MISDVVVPFEPYVVMALVAEQAAHVEGYFATPEVLALYYAAVVTGDFVVIVIAVAFSSAVVSV